jgi:hypothetical protein
MNIASNPKLCPDNVLGECTRDPFPAKKVWFNGQDISHKINTIDNSMCADIDCDRKKAKVSGHYSMEFERKIKSKER